VKEVEEDEVVEVVEEMEALAGRAGWGILAVGLWSVVGGLMVMVLVCMCVRKVFRLGIYNR